MDKEVALNNLGGTSDPHNQKGKDAEQGDKAKEPIQTEYSFRLAYSLGEFDFDCFLNFDCILGVPDDYWFGPEFESDSQKGFKKFASRPQELKRLFSGIQMIRLLYETR